MAQADIGLIGLAVMGENLILNMESKGFTVACYNRTVSKVDDFMNARAKGKNIIGCRSIEELIAGLKTPRKIMIMVKAGKPVDEFIDQLLPHLSNGDILIDGGNSNYQDTIRRTAHVESQGKLYIGTGVSGGEEGALLGPAIMPGGSHPAWEHVKPIFQKIAAKAPDGVPCCEWMGDVGSGHFVKMVHNGIEYGMMQAFAEGFALMKHKPGFDLDLGEIAELWRHGSVVRSWLLDLSADFLAHDQNLDAIQPFVADSGEGRWTALEAVEQGIPAPVMSLALMMRFASQGRNDFAAKMLAKMRQGFGGHAIKEG